MLVSSASLRGSRPREAWLRELAAWVARLSVADPYEQLRAAMVGGQLQPDERLVEADLSEAPRAPAATAPAGRVRRGSPQEEGLIEHHAQPRRAACA